MNHIANPRKSLLDLDLVHWRRLMLGMMASAVLAMSVHVVMFDVLLVPHPQLASVPHLALFANDALSIGATLWLCRLLQPELLRIPLLLRWLLVAAVYAMLGEALVRNFLMDGVVSHAWRFSLIENLARPSEDMVTCCLIVCLAPRLDRNWQVVAAAAAIAALAALFVNPLLSGAFDRLTASFEYLDTGNSYNPPYGWQVNVPSYLTFLEPVLASFAIVAICWRRLDGSLLSRLVQFTLLLMAIKGSILPTLVFSFFQALPLPQAITSESQFGLEVGVLGICTALSWHCSTRRPRSEARSNLQA